MHHIQKRGNLSEINKLGILGLFFSLGLAAVSTIWAIYLESILHNPSHVGFITAFFVIVGTLTYIFGVPLLEKAKKIKLYAIITSLFILAYVLFSILSDFWAVIILGTVTSILGSLRVSLYGVIVRNKSKDENVSKNEGLIYTILNASWFIAPIAAGYIAASIGMRFVFLVAAAMFLVSLFLLRIFRIKDNTQVKTVDKNPLKVFFEFFKDKNRTLAYVLGGGIDFWWVLIYIYVPIYVFQNGFGETTIGYFLAAVILPLIFIEYYIGKLASKKGFKGIFILGYSIMAAAALACFFVSNIYIMLLILSIASFGAGMVEPTTESYFFDIIKKGEREKYYSTYNTTINISSFVARIISAILLLFLPFKSLFIFFALAMLTVAIISRKTKMIIEIKKRN